MIEPHAWVSNRVALATALAGNSVAWLHSAAVENISVGTAVTGITGITMALVGGAIYAIKNLGPVWIQFRKDLDMARSQTLSGQMETLIASLDIANREKASHEQLANIAKQSADRLQSAYDQLKAMYDNSEKRNAESEKRNVETLALLEAMKVDLRKLNEKQHASAAEANGYKLTVKMLEMELADYKAKIGPVITQQNANTQKLAEMDANIRTAGSVLSHSADPDKE